MLSPIILSANITVPVRQAVEPPDKTRLQNPFKSAMWLDEIRFRILPVTPETTTQPNRTYIAARAEFSLGRDPLTNVPIPVGNFGRLISTGFAGFPFPGTSFPSQQLMYHTWKLPKPLFIPATELLNVKIHHIPTVTDPDVTDLNLEIVYVGRSLPLGYKPPKTINLPWVTMFEVPSLEPTTETRVITTSTEKDLVNPFNMPLYVQRFIGRQWNRTILNPTIDTILEYAQSRNSSNWTVNTTLTAADYRGAIMIRDPSTWAQVFSIIDRSWTVNTVLPPKGFYKMRVDQNFTTPGTFISDFVDSIGGFVSMIGHREVVLSL